MALDTLIETLEANGRRRAADILREARAEVRRIRRRAEREEARRRKEILAARARALRDELSGEIARVRADGRRAALEARRALLDRVFERARERLPSALDSDAFRDALPARIAAARRYVPGDAAVLACHPELARVARSAIDASDSRPDGGDGAVDVDVRADPGIGAGFQLRSGDGRVTVDDTLEGRLARRRPELEIALLERLAPRPPDGRAGVAGRS